MTKKRINTKYGRAYLNDNGYYVLPLENSKNKLLHREIFEDFYQCTLPADVVIHHKDGNKTNNSISNLFPMTRAEHTILHAKENAKHKPKPIKKDIHAPKSEAHKKKLAESICLKNNTSGYYRVRKEKKKNGGINWRYRWKEDGKLKSISRQNIPDLKKEVLCRGLEWFEIKNGVKV